MDNRQIVLAERPVGSVNESTTTVVTSPRPECGEGEALIKVAMLSIDPTIRTWMDDAPGYLPPIGIGDVIRGSGAGVVVESRNDYYHEGDFVFGMTGWQEWVLATDDRRFSIIPKGLGLDLATVMNVLGVTGITAYFGMIEVGGVREGDVAVVSGAAGGARSVAGPLGQAPRLA
jgi:NADPH-dependent curcumin reductase CurA